MADIQTLFLVVMLISFLLSVSLAAVAVGAQRDLRLWAGGLALQVLGYALLLARPLMPEWLSVVGANVAFGATIALYSEGVCRFQARQPHRPLIWATPLIFLMLFPWLVEQYETRVVVAASLFLFQAVLLGKLVVEGLSATPGRGQYLLLAGIGLWGGLQIFRLIAQLSGIGSSHALLEASLLQSLTFLSSMSASLLLAFGVLVMMRERAEAVLTSSERHYRRLIEHADEGVAVIERLAFRYVNPYLSRLCGRPLQDLIDRPYTDVIHPDDRAMSLVVHRQRLLGLAEDRAYEVRLLRPDGGVRWVRITGVRFDWQGRPASLAFMTDVTAAHLEEAQIRDLAFQDSLTGLANRRRLLEQLDDALAEAIAQRQGGALVFLDLDNFKPLNDAHGHAAGDLLLREVAHRLRAVVRQRDVVARFGGDEFVLLITGLDSHPVKAAHQACTLAEKVRAALAQPYRLTSAHGTLIEHACTASVGVALFGPDGPAATVLLERADRAMYEAKQGGRNQVAMDPEAVAPCGSAAVSES